MNSSILKREWLCLIVISLLCFSSTYGTDLLDLATDKSRLNKDLKDVYRAFSINHQIEEQKEFINLYLNEGSEEELNAKLAGYIKVCDGLKQTTLFNDTLKNYVSKYLASTIRNYKIALSNGFNSAVFKKDYKKYAIEFEIYQAYLRDVYSTSRFVEMTEDTYWKLNDKNNYIKSAGYPTYQKQKKINLKTAMVALDKIAGQTADFQEYSIYAIEKADQYVKHPAEFGSNATESAIKKYKEILDRKEYSIYLFEAWLKWRTVFQQNNGLSKSSDIPNDEYNKVREQVALTILNYVTNNPKNKMAINEFLLVATHDIVKRFGDYPYGNQNTIEYHEIFDEKK